MEPFVCVELLGGLGNQLFQYAAAKSIATRLGYKLLLNKESNNAHNTNGHNYTKELFTDAEEVDIPTHAHWIFEAHGIRIYNQQNGFEAWNPMEINSACLLKGYFQYYPAIEETIPQIRTLLLQNLKVTKLKSDYAFLHVRRGDYVKKSEFHYLQSESYYIEAYRRLCEIRGRHGPPTNIFIFSDDIEWCRSQRWLVSLPGAVCIEENDELKSLAQMITCTGGAIIANSTFSWWAAMLSDTPYVVYPTKWIAQKIEVLFPDKWIAV
jgi:hypothetical protein